MRGHLRVILPESIVHACDVRLTIAARPAKVGARVEVQPGEVPVVITFTVPPPLGPAEGNLTASVTVTPGTNVELWPHVVGGAVVVG